MSQPWRAYAAAMVDALARSGYLPDPAWQTAMREVPRHLFLPDQPFDAAYVAEAIVTQTRPAYALGGDRVDLPTSSVSDPTAVAVMLDRLRLTGWETVLEIGTGSGYNTALLCHRLGDHHVHSVDIDPGLVGAARQTLATIGFNPRVVAGDGHAGLPDGAIIATCAVRNIPPAWIDQLSHDGRIVAPCSEPTMRR